MSTVVRWFVPGLLIALSAEAQPDSTGNEEAGAKPRSTVDSADGPDSGQRPDSAQLQRVASAVEVRTQSEDGEPETGLPLGLDPSQLNKQWITKLHYAGPEGDFGMDLIFRLQSAERFSILAKDRFGRSWWELAVDQGRALSLERRQQTYCVYDRSVEIAAIPLGPLEFSVLPQLILGRLPFEPSAKFHRGDGRWSLQDQQWRDWMARVDDGRLVSWTLVDQGKPQIWWSGSGSRWALSAAAQRLQLRWRNGALRPLARAPTDLTIPDGYTEVCDRSSLVVEDQN